MADEEVDFEDFIRSATEDELREANDLIVTELKHRRKMQGQRNKRLLRPGSGATTINLKGGHSGKNVVIKEINRSRARVLFEGETIPVNVPLECRIPKE